MKFQNFQYFICQLREIDEINNVLYKTGIDILSYSEKYQKIIILLLKEIYGEIGYDLIFWWLYEDVEKCIRDSKTGKKIDDLTTLEELWKYVEKIKDSKN